MAPDEPDPVVTAPVERRQGRGPTPVIGRPVVRGGRYTHTAQIRAEQKETGICQI